MESLTLVLVVLVFGLSTNVALEEKTRYDGYKVFHVVPTTEDQLETLKELEHGNLELNFWEESSFVGKAADVMMPPHLQNVLVDSLQRDGFKVSEFISDVQKLIDDEVVNENPNLRLSFTAYHSYSVIQAFLNEQASLHPHAQVVNIGKTFEGRDLLGLKISKGQNKPVIFVESGIHAREWIAPAVATYLIDQLLNGNDPVLQKWIEDYEWIIIPVANPDGYTYTSFERLWRKTRSTVSGSICRGADPNRNFGFRWGTGGSSTNPCSETFQGTAAFSEPETRALSNYISTVADRLVFYLDLHSYSQLILLPYGVNYPLPEHNAWMAFGNRARDALARRYGTQFTVGNIVDLLYVASGGSVDWVKGTYNTKLALVYELRDKGNYGFILPAAQIIPSGLEFMDSLKSLMVDVATL